jgi:hypothetical protein
MERGKNGGKRKGVCFTSMRHRPLRNARPSRKNSGAAPPRRWVVGFSRHVLRRPPGALILGYDCIQRNSRPRMEHPGNESATQGNEMGHGYTTSYTA